jgi:hypothetical protein
MKIDGIRKLKDCKRCGSDIVKLYKKGGSWYLQCHICLQWVKAGSPNDVVICWQVENDKMNPKDEKE